MKKILGVLRVSTDSQDVASQKAEMVEFAKELGYKEEQIQWLEFVGLFETTKLFVKKC